MKSEDMHELDDTSLDDPEYKEFLNSIKQLVEELGLDGARIVRNGKEIWRTEKEKHE